ncbi:MAG: hypothetical protein GF308_03330 [Candidatus Heimdallarchaeota archaeon]|nr:hypothetical protein [Candidatus Heimdallarchaeota archaeon]
MKKKVGLPRALIFYKFEDMWITFFEELGAEVIVSPKTNKQIKKDALKCAPEEDCYSTKLYFGHVMALKDKVDYLFIPRFGSDHKVNVGCPKFIGLAKVLQSMFPELPEIIMPFFSKAKSGHGLLHFLRLSFQIGFKFTKNPFRIIRAIRKAWHAYKAHKKQLIIDETTLKQWEKSEILLNDPPKLRENEEPVKIALVGHSYVINDPFSSLNARQLLADHGVDIITSEQMPRKLIENQMDKLDFNMYFNYEREILGTIMHFIESKTIDGIIHLIIFSCGPDSVAGEMAAQLSKRDPEVPLLQLTFDELTGEAGLRTRIEAFVDMIRRCKSENLKMNSKLKLVKLAQKIQT